MNITINELPDFLITSVSHKFHGFIKVPEYKYKGNHEDDEIEPRNLIKYEVEFYGNTPFSITLKIPTYGVFYEFMCTFYMSGNNELSLGNFNDELFDKTLTHDYCKKIVTTIAEKLSHYIVGPKITELNFWEDGYKYAGYDKMMRNGK